MAGKYYSETHIVRILRIRRSILRRMEEERIVSPRLRTGERFYSPEQVADLVFARDLLQDMGVNLAGVEVAIKMRRNMREIESQLDQIFEYLKSRIENLREE